MNQIDIVILVVIGISALSSLWRGLVREILSLFIWITALVAAVMFSESVALILSESIENELLRFITAFCLLFLSVLIAGALFGKALDGALKASGLSLFDKFLGALFGVARGITMVLVCLYVLNFFVSESSWWQESTLIPYGMAMINLSQVLIGDWDWLGSRTQVI